MPVPIDPKDIRFLEKRRKLVGWWNVVGSVMFTVLAAFIAWMFWSQPRLINPLHVVGELEGGGISQTMLELMAVMLPIAVLALLLVMAVMIAFTFAMIGNERRYLRVIDRLRQEREGETDNDGGKKAP